MRSRQKPSQRKWLSFSDWVVWRWSAASATIISESGQGVDQTALIGRGMILGLHVTGFAAGPAVILAIFAQAGIKLAAAEPAILGAWAAAFDLIAQAANVILGHSRRLSRFEPAGNTPNVPALQAYLEFRPAVQASTAQASSMVRTTASLGHGVSSVGTGRSGALTHAKRGC